MLQPLAYEVPRRLRITKRQRVLQAAGLAAGIIAPVNFCLVFAAATDRSAGALAIMLVVGPATNLAMILLSLAFAPLVRRVGGSASIAPYLLAGTLIPTAAIVVDTMCIFAMDVSR
jgi:hypothetical protein